MLSPSDIAALVGARATDPFALLGMHARDGQLWVSALLPKAQKVCVLNATGAVVVALRRVHDAGLFDGLVGEGEQCFTYRLLVEWDEIEVELEDPYRFPPLLGATDVWLIAEGKHEHLYDVLGAHPCRVENVEGCRFAVWAPSAQRVSVVGDFNYWDGCRHPMRLRRECGVWEIFLPGVGAGARYKFELVSGTGKLLPQKSDPLAFACELRPATASIVNPLPASPQAMGHFAARDQPLTIYEFHAGSWRRTARGGFLNWHEIADQLLPYVVELGFTHIELLPVTEHPFDGSWGYQPTGLYAPTARHGTPADFAAFVTRCKSVGIGVLLDWVPGHFPSDPHSLANFDGTHLYEHADPRRGVHRDWDTLIYNYGRHEVRNFLSANARFWIERYGLDGLRVDAVASMLYLDYSRPAGEWLPNAQGGRENLEAVAFLRATNQLLSRTCPRAVTIAEESTSWPRVSYPTEADGLGFTYKWNMGWMHDTLEYMRRDPVHRRHHHDQLTFGLLYAFSENFVLPLSHDEVVHGKGSLLGKMPGDRWQRFANLRLYYGFMWAHPGKKLLFMGGEFGQVEEWNHDTELSWSCLSDPAHNGVRKLIGDLNRTYRTIRALHAFDWDSRGFQWLDCEDREQSVLAFVRRAPDDTQLVVVVCNFTPVPRRAYRVGVPCAGHYRELINTDSAWYGGSDLGNAGGVATHPVAAHGHAQSLTLILPPLACVMLVLDCD